MHYNAMQCSLIIHTFMLEMFNVYTCYIGEAFLFFQILTLFRWRWMGWWPWFPDVDHSCSFHSSFEHYLILAALQVSFPSPQAYCFPYRCGLCINSWWDRRPLKSVREGQRTLDQSLLVGLFSRLQQRMWRIQAGRSLACLVVMGMHCTILQD